MANEHHFTVIKDTREQKGYNFSKTSKGRCAGMVVEKLDTGDYTLLGLENKICVERKASVEELALNLGQKKHPFMREIDRMAGFPHRFLILEFDLEDVIEFPNHVNSRIPESQRKDLHITSQYIVKCLTEFQVHKDIHVLFCGNKYKAFLAVMSIFKRINEMYTAEE